MSIISEKLSPDEGVVRTSRDRISMDNLSNCSPQRFKKRSEFYSEAVMNEILNSRSRISMCGITGKCDVIYTNNQVNENGEISRSSNIMWQLPYSERKQFIEMESEKRLSKL
jgi:hypothetical protein